MRVSGRRGGAPGPCPEPAKAAATAGGEPRPVGVEIFGQLHTIERIERTGSPSIPLAHVECLVFASFGNGGPVFFAGSTHAGAWTQGAGVQPGKPLPSPVRRRALAVAVSLFGIGLSASFVLIRVDAALQTRSAGVAFEGSRSSGGTGERIIPGSPAVTELIFALGQGHRVVGVADPCTYPPEALTLPRVGSLYNPNFERLTLLRPDLVVVQGHQDRLRAWAARAGVEYHSVGRLDSLEDLRQVIADLGDLLGVPGEAERLRARIDRGLEQVATMVQGADRVKVFLTFGRTPGNLENLYTCGPGSFLNDLLQVAGGRNVFADASGAFPMISKEALLERGPEVILELFPRPLDVDTARKLRQDWRALAGIPAVSAGRVVFLQGSRYQIPGPRVVEAAEAFARALHPELFGDE